MIDQSVKRTALLRLLLLDLVASGLPVQQTVVVCYSSALWCVKGYGEIIPPGSANVTVPFGLIVARVLPRGKGTRWPGRQDRPRRSSRAPSA
jgi:hypothetical protein